MASQEQEPEEQEPIKRTAWELALYDKYPDIYLPPQFEGFESEDIMDLPYAEDGEGKEVCFPPDDWEPGPLTNF